MHTIQRGIPIFIDSVYGKSNIHRYGFSEIRQEEYTEIMRNMKFKNRILFVMDPSIGDNMICYPIFLHIINKIGINNVTIDICTTKDIEFLYANWNINRFYTLEDWKFRRIKALDYRYFYKFYGQGITQLDFMRRDRFDVFKKSGKISDDIELSVEKININPIKNEHICIAVESNSARRTWDTSMLKVKELSERIASEGFVVELLGADRKDILDNDNKNIINNTGLTTLKYYCDIISGCKFCITCGDTGSEHIAGMFNIPQIAMFGVTKPELRLSKYESAYGFFKEKSCKYMPCEKFANQRGIVKNCNMSCLENITAEEVYKKFMEMVD